MIEPPFELEIPEALPSLWAEVAPDLALAGTTTAGSGLAVAAYAQHISTSIGAAACPVFLLSWKGILALTACFACAGRTSRTTTPIGNGGTVRTNWMVARPRIATCSRREPFSSEEESAPHPDAEERPRCVRDEASTGRRLRESRREFSDQSIHFSVLQSRRRRGRPAPDRPTRLRRPTLRGG